MQQNSESAACWQQIGTFGDRSCARLESEVHCRNCEIFRAGGRALLDRPLPEGYREEITAQLKAPLERETQEGLRVVAFRVGGAWLALDSGYFLRTLPTLPIVPLPGRSNAVFRGLVNAQGELSLCVSLRGLIRAELDQSVIDVSARVFSRMLEIRLAGDLWIFEADEVVGAVSVAEQHLEPLPVNLGLSLQGLVSHLLFWQGIRLALLDPKQLEVRLRGALQ